MNRVNGSGAYVAACRAAWIVVKDKGDEARRLLLPLKNNLGPDQGGLAYRVIVAQNGAPRVEFEAEPVNIRADDALAAPGDDEGADDPGSFLRELLADGAMSARDVQKEARGFGLTDKQLRSARERLGIKPRKTGMDTGWMWELPAEDAPKMPKMPTVLEGHLQEKRASSGEPDPVEAVRI
ncbi:AAA ATPase [mine drainage metagenome]|uniref:AAA ATPase n=1 Tax=mine drainage metagenome TaxID=410659 RepID=T1DB82_9ZZZZ